MANPAKRAADDPRPSTSGKSTDAPARVVPPKAKAKAKAGGRAAAKPGATPPPGAGSSDPARRYTAPTARAAKRPSPRWVPILMFGLWAAGLLVIILNYMGVLPGAADGGNGWYLVAGLVSILGGIMVATQYR